MSRQAALVTGIIIIVLLFMCNIGVALFAIPRVLAFVNNGRPAAVQPTPRPAAPNAPNTAPLPTPTASTNPVPRATARPVQPLPPAPGPQITLVIPGGNGGGAALPSATPGASPTLGPSPTPFPTVAPLALSAQEQALAALYNRTRPGVVNIDVVVGAPAGADGGLG